jgi:hypothetical protein
MPSPGVLATALGSAAAVGVVSDAAAGPGAGPLLAPTSEECLLRTRTATAGPATLGLWIAGECWPLLLCSEPSWEPAVLRGGRALRACSRTSVLRSDTCSSRSSRRAVRVVNCAHTRKRQQRAGVVCVGQQHNSCWHCNAWTSLTPVVTAAQAVPCSLPAPGLQTGPPSLSHSLVLSLGTH